MRYQGGKVRIAKKLVAVIESYRKPGQLYIEPFLGAGAVFRRVANPRVGFDLDPDLMALWRGIAEGFEFPSELNRAMYYRVKAAPENYNPALVGFVAFLMSFGGKKWGGYVTDNRGDDYCGAAIRTVAKAKAETQGALLLPPMSYDALAVTNALIYCDPPYKGTTGYPINKANPFNHAAFYAWCEAMTRLGNTVLVSEYQAPESWEVVLEVQNYKTLGATENSEKATEKLFKVRI